MRIGPYDIDQQTLIVAEIGVNHEGNFDLAQRMIGEAAEAGAHAVKFQTYYVSKNTYLSNAIDEERYQRTMGYEFSFDQFRELKRSAEDNGLIFLSTPFDLESLDVIDELCPAIKIASGDLTFIPLLEKAAQKSKPIILSTGMASEQEIEAALEVIKRASPKPLNETVILLHCVSSYPCPDEHANLDTMVWLEEQFAVRTGYSDHTLGIFAATAAICMGACVIEKHFTYQKEGQTFRDHAISADKDDMRQLVENANKIKVVRGTVQKQRNALEAENAVAMRRSLGAMNDLRKGDLLTKENITFLRPASGLPTSEFESVLGRRITRNIEKGSILLEGDLER